MHKITFYPVGNGDTSQIILENGKRILFDYRHLKKTEEDEGPEINLKAKLKEELEEANKNSFDVVAFTHGDQDHIENSTEFFELLHANKYQGDGRIKIDELWVPAAMIIETVSSGGQSAEFPIWRQEARYRLKKGKGIRVFSKPDKLKDWFVENDLDLDSSRHLITDAGQVAPGLTLEDDGVEFFCHSPFIKHTDEGEDMRNKAALVFNVRFKAGDNMYDYFAIGDSKWEVMEDIVDSTKAHGNDDRLNWDILNVSHHCSYLALSDDKGNEETTPKPKVKELLQSGKEGGYMVCSSQPIEDTKAGSDQDQPPHIQAKKCYVKYLNENDGAKFLVTMEESKVSKPKPIVIKIDRNGISRIKEIEAATVSIISSQAPKAG